jgi:murein L,D-transpeptidase YafK
MKPFIVATMLVVAVALSGCGGPSIKRYDGPAVTRVLVYKESRKMYLMHNDTALRVFDIELGFAPTGHKSESGDGRTPVGDYIIDRRNPESSFHLSIGISYPNAADMARAQAKGIDPGGDIFIHGQPNAFRAKGDDWTWGCIAVNNDEIEDIYSMVGTGTPISIYD